AATGVAAAGWGGAVGGPGVEQTTVFGGPERWAEDPETFSRTKFVGVAAGFRSPYRSGGGRIGATWEKPGATGSGAAEGGQGGGEGEGAWAEGPHDAPAAGGAAGFGAGGAGAHYQGDLISASERYARMVLALTRGERFDVVHAHDWLTFPAGIAAARATGRPLVVHVHSTEFDRAGDGVNQRVYEIERRGMVSAMRVICVSELTKGIVVRRYGIDASRVDVVYNGIENSRLQPHAGDRIQKGDRIVLFLGRITMQKGPEYFIAAAKKVLEKVPEAKFIVAGSGDMELRMVELAAEMGIGHRVLFTGFLRGADVDRVYRMADCYVMPSVSEPFGIAPLEAIRNDVPTIISKQSGVSEVLTHALKVDFWDTHEIANKIVAVLRHPPLGQTLRQHGALELHRLTWEGAAKACEQTYSRALEAQGKPLAAARA
ncbi:MAG: glycosyltransferase family 4 protein, partial [Phycisphaerae bacterium]|nr:glycosyltransferase family 4 protein [Phycisphaerae bacterium]